MSTTVQPKKQHSPFVRWLAILTLVGAIIFLAWGAGRRSFAPPSAQEARVIAVVDRTLDAVEARVSDDAVSLRYPVQQAIQPDSTAADDLERLLLATICNMKQAEVVGTRHVYIDVLYQNRALFIVGVNPATLANFNCDNPAWVQNANLESVASQVQWSVG